MTNGEEGGQIQGELKFKYNLFPIQAETSYADIIKIQDCLQAGMKSTTLKVPENYEPLQTQSFFEIEGSDICMSILKRPESMEENKIIIRLYNMSDKPAIAKVKCFKALSDVAEVNLLEEYLRSVVFEDRCIDVELDAWKIQTYSIVLT
jgi:alpha-mannosidase